jgi:4-hydroxyphenylacetate 3-monooxygenase
VLHNPATRGLFEELWRTPTTSALDRFKLYKLAWDLLGTDFAGRHLQYERFYMGPAFVVRGHNHRECPWSEIDDYVGSLLDRIEVGPVLDQGFVD